MIVCCGYLSLFIAYVIGGVTLLPISLLVLYFAICFKQKAILNKPVPSDILERHFLKEENALNNNFYKVGWLHVDKDVQATGKATSIGGIVKSYLSGSSGKLSLSNYSDDAPRTNQSFTGSKKPNDIPTYHYFAVLKLNMLYLYDSELQLDCKGIINVNNHTIHIFPYGLKDHELFSKSSRILLKKKRKLFLEDIHQQKEYYINCSRNVDKEDWYFALLRASKLRLSSHAEPMIHDFQESLENPTTFDQNAMNHLISNIHSNPSQFEMQWFNALLGRIFLGIYKTDNTKSFFYNKILSKIEKLNARRPPFLEEISLRSVDAGHSAPQITQPRFIHLTPQGEYTGDLHISYDGHFRVELETVLKWKYSDRLPPIRIDLVLAITLRSIEGKLMVKIKEPPTNRAWLGFYRKPKMEWIVEPVVWEKRIGYSVVSKAIQAKIEEILTETIVLPNMDDMVFFQTNGVGGIFGKQEDLGSKQMECNDHTSLSYRSLPELYSAPSDLIVTEDHLSTSVSSLASTAVSSTPVRKGWFRRNSTYQPPPPQDSADSTISASSDSDTPSQKTLKSVMLYSEQQMNGKNKKLSRRKKASSSASSTRQQFLAASVDHSTHSISTSHVKGQSNMDIPSDVLNNAQSMRRESAAVHALRLSKQMLSLGDKQAVSRNRSKSLPSTGLCKINSIPDNDDYLMKR